MIHAQKTESRVALPTWSKTIQKVSQKYVPSNLRNYNRRQEFLKRGCTALEMLHIILLNLFIFS